MNSYEVFLTETVEEKIKKKHRDKEEHLESQMKKLRKFPKKYGKPLKGGLHGYWQLRLDGKFRIWYTIDEDESKVIIEAIKHKDEAKKYY